ncbi:MAG: CPBP family intramembrane glutamic endopeptidase, partial [Myxococcota bacterium]
ATLLICAGLVGAAVYLQKKHKIRPIAFAPLLLESTVLAFGMLISVGWLTQQVVAVPPLAAGMDLSPFAKVVLSCGAGFHEELVFRVVVFGGLFWFADRHIARTWLALIVAAVVSSVLFSAIHYVGSLSDAFTLSSFVFRTIAGLYLTAVYRLRGFAVAVYTHAIYDIFVMFFFGA